MKWLRVGIAAFVLASVLSAIEGHPEFQARIPNGDRVPNPCNRSIIWQGVGHQNSAGGGPRNPFGLDFKANGLVWNATICSKDSDGDGWTNGYELGDPECKWTVNATPSGVAITHPGICEPLDKSNCIPKNTWLTNCKPPTFDCPAINESGVKSYVARLPLSPVPVQRTTNMCYQFQFPANTVNDIIAFEPIVDNAHVLHHMSIRACADKPWDHDTNQIVQCDLTGTSCGSNGSKIASWTVGDVGQCQDSHIGLRIGPGEFQYGILQLHWDNHDLLSGLTDSSGMTIYHTSNLRPYSGAIFGVGVEDFEIPANTPNIVVSGGCSSACTKRFTRSFNITNTRVHMHRLGRSGNITLYRDGKYLLTIQDVRGYDFNTPAIKDLPEPLEILPGDEVKISCVYDSTGKMTPTHYGLGTYDEMCYGFFAYYPKSPQANLCTNWRTIDVCYPNSYIYSKCNITALSLLADEARTKCSEGCNSTACTNTMESVYNTGCPSQPEAMQFLYLFPRKQLSNDTAFFQCLNATQPMYVTTTDWYKNHAGTMKKST